MAAYLPPGWPAGVHPPGSEGFERTAVAWLLDVVPPDYRLYGVLRRHPVALATMAKHHVAACVEGARDGYRTARTELGDQLPPPGVEAVLAAYRKEGKRLVATASAVDLVLQALRGEIPRGGQTPAARNGGQTGAARNGGQTGAARNSGQTRSAVQASRPRAPGTQAPGTQEAQPSREGASQGGTAQGRTAPDRTGREKAGRAKVPVAKVARLEDAPSAAARSARPAARRGLLPRPGQPPVTGRDRGAC
jgi:hypothetical protein